MSEPRYIVAVSDINGRHIRTEDTESACREWLWRTLNHLHDSWPPRLAFFVKVEVFERLDEGPRRD